MDKIIAFLFFVHASILLWIVAGAANELNLKRHSTVLFIMVVVSIVSLVAGFYLKELLIILFS